MRAPRLWTGCRCFERPLLSGVVSFGDRLLRVAATGGRKAAVPLPPERLRALRVRWNLGVCSIGGGGGPVRGEDRRRTNPTQRKRLHAIVHIGDSGGVYAGW